MAALMDIEKVMTPEMENGGGLFDPDLNDVEMSRLTSKTALVSPTSEDFDLLQEDIKTRILDTQGETIYEVGTGDSPPLAGCSQEQNVLYRVYRNLLYLILLAPHIDFSKQALSYTLFAWMTNVLEATSNLPKGDRPGLKEDDFNASVATLRSIAESLDLECVLLRERSVEEGKAAEFLLRKRLQSEDFMEVRVAVVGNVDAGKSTLLGVLTHGDLDNGRGMARQKLFRHKHEMESGRTSSVGNDILGFDASGGVVNKPEHGHLDWIKICEESAKVVTFIDLAGHERYLKTTVFGMTGHAPDFAMLMIGANAGVIGMTKEHLGLSLALNVPVFVVVTKIDMCPPNVLQETLKLLTRILKSPGCRKIPVLVQNIDDVVVTATNFTSERMCPVFQVSNVTGENLNLLKMFLNLLSTRVRCDASEPAEFQIDDTFSVPGVGTVVSGTLLQGQIKLNDTLLLGPDALGQFQPVPIRSIHRKRMPVREVRGGQTASFSLKKIKRASIRKGMVMVSSRIEPKACWEFEGEILVLHHPTTISVKYQAMVHVGSVRQTATIISMTQEHLRTGDKATVRFRFIKNPEYLKTDMRMVFREGRTKAVGNITKLFPHVSAVAQNTRHQRSAKKTQQDSGKHSVNPQNEPQKASKRNRRAKKMPDFDDGEGKENAVVGKSSSESAVPSCSSSLSASASASATSAAAAAAAAN